MFWCGSASKPDFRGQPRGAKAIVCYYIEELDTTTVATPKMWPAAVPRFYLFKAAHSTVLQASRKIWGWYNIWRNRTHNRNVGQPYKHWPTTSNKITAATAVTFWLPPPAAGRAPALYGPAPEPNRFRERILRRFDRKFSLVAEFATGERRIVVIQRWVALQIPVKILLFSIFFRD